MLYLNAKNSLESGQTCILQCYLSNTYLSMSKYSYKKIKSTHANKINKKS